MFELFVSVFGSYLVVMLIMALIVIDIIVVMSIEDYEFGFARYNKQESIETAKLLFAQKQEEERERQQQLAQWEEDDDPYAQDPVERLEEDYRPMSSYELHFVRVVHESTYSFIRSPYDYLNEDGTLPEPYYSFEDLEILEEKTQKSEQINSKWHLLETIPTWGNRDAWFSLQMEISKYTEIDLF